MGASIVVGAAATAAGALRGTGHGGGGGGRGQRGGGGRVVVGRPVCATVRTSEYGGCLGRVWSEHCYKATHWTSGFSMTNPPLLGRSCFPHRLCYIWPNGLMDLS